jgi:L-arabinokinase
VRTIVFYISGHGFGHASRDIEVINALLARRGDVRIIARTSAPEWLFERTVTTAHRRAFEQRTGETDTGVVQIDSLHLDEHATIDRARQFMRTFEQRVGAEAAFLREQHAALAIADIPPLGIAAAKQAGIPALGFGNFTWDWIYTAYPDADAVVGRMRDAYANADGALRLPMHGGFDGFTRIVDLPFVARRSLRSPEDTKRALGFPPDQRLVLLSFGGYGLDRIDQEAVTRLDGYTVIGSRQHPLNESAMYGAGFRYEDVVRAVDVVVSKPGYGIISECIANGTALLYTSRGRFSEYDVFVREMPKYLRVEFIDHDRLFAGRWQEALDALLTQAPPPERPPVNGAEVAADLLLDMI